jgi:hypothetical protein
VFFFFCSSFFWVFFFCGLFSCFALWFACHLAPAFSGCICGDWGARIACLRGGGCGFDAFWVFDKMGRERRETPTLRRAWVEWVVQKDRRRHGWCWLVVMARRAWRGGWWVARRASWRVCCGVLVVGGGGWWWWWRVVRRGAPWRVWVDHPSGGGVISVIGAWMHFAFLPHPYSPPFSSPSLSRHYYFYPDTNTIRSAVRPFPPQPSAVFFSTGLTVWVCCSDVGAVF